MAMDERAPEAAEAGARLGRDLSDAVVLFHEALGSLMGLSAADHKALGIVRREGPMSARELAERTGLTAGAVTGLVDRLVAAGLARRTPDPADRRRVVIEATVPADAAVSEAVGRMVAGMAEVNSHFTPEQLRVVAEWVERTTAVLREQAHAISHGSPA
ncbi:MarR family transcriptional regulator [Micromonospora sp. C28SCA-DRY-2]|uniref:MarR family winged helix-turn-helix transcriptional regulator n=1 Tax=Micromonospora sp. C28SCA-DRY-2 TaxID=3059522 RepID=UPI002676775F|nr:MarR family transcriptional regulator [Micromonospora sp. C28SCA-DRY-2]MDO3703552.1 MarR family transcriptional regulator [Micromonospora sp. C28SCA-DRY-2]